MPRPIMSEFQSMTSIDGLIQPTATAAVPVMDRGFLYGDSIYEVFRTYDGVPLFYEEHWKRFQNSADLIHLRLQYSMEDIGAEVKRTVKASGAVEAKRDVYVRYVVTRGEGALGLLPDAKANQRLIVIVMAVPEWNQEFYSSGVSLAISRTRRNEPHTLDPNIKGGNYLNNVMGVIEAREQGADDCLMLDSADLITEASNSNVFFVLNNEVLTPSQVSANLKGITKESVRQICAAGGIPYREAELALDDLLAADECFITSATREIMPVRKVLLGDGRSRDFPAGGGPQTRTMAGLYKQFVRDYVENHQHYSMY